MGVSKEKILEGRGMSVYRLRTKDSEVPTLWGRETPSYEERAGANGRKRIQRFEKRFHTSQESSGEGDVELQKDGNDD